MNYIGIDYSASKAYLAVANGSEVLHYSELALEKDSVEAFLRNVQSELAFIWSRHGMNGVGIYIEQPWSREGAYAWTGLATARMAAYLEAAALLQPQYRFKPCFVLPGVWRKTVLGNGRPKNAKQVAVTWAKEQYDFLPPSLKVRSYEADHNYCEALAIAHYGVLQNGET